MTIATDSVGSTKRTLLTFTPLSHLDQARELVAAIQQLSLAGSIEEIQRVVRTAARRLTGADGATFVLREGDTCYYADENAISPLWKGQRFPIEADISGWAMTNGRPAVIEDIYADDRIPHDAYRSTFVNSLATVPIRTLDPVGAIGNYWAERHQPTYREVELLQALADSTAVAMEAVQINRQLEEERLDALQRLARVAEYRDDATFKHTERVAGTAQRLGELLGLPRSEIALIYQAAPLHDIGKLTIPDSILLKPERLTREEFEQVKGHATAGATLLSGSHSEVLCLAEEIALTHHEWWDGSGYPAGLSGKDIPIAGQLVALADVFDALTHERPYKKAWPLAKALEEIDDLRNRQFDPEIVDAFTKMTPGAFITQRDPAQAG
ncbi:MAG TPA: HD domain-containing phosphohydrolase [Solirubrobacterales bacterium]